MANGGNGGTPPPPPPTCLDDPTDDDCTGPTQTDIDMAKDAAASKLEAMRAEFTQVTDAGLGGSAVTNAHTLEITRDAAGTEVEITVAGAATDDPKFLTMPTDLDLSEANGFAGTMNVLTMDADINGNVVEEVVVVRTDIDAPMATPFAEVDDQALNTNPDGGVNQSLTINTNNVDLSLIHISEPTRPY